MNRQRLFIASCVALIATAMSFAIRGDIITDLEATFSLTKTNLGWINGAAFWSFGLFIIFGGPLVDFLGMRRLLLLAVACHIVGTLMTIFAPSYLVLFLATFIVGAGNGLVEAVCNPLIAAAYPDEKTHKLTVFHAWFPGGIVIGGLLCYLLFWLSGSAGEGEVVPTIAGIASWKLKMATLLIPSAVYLFMVLPLKFPATERVAAGVPFSEMCIEAVRRPLFWVLFLMMWLTASTELVPGGWIRNIYGDVMGSGTKEGILFLVWGSGLMWFLRQFCSKPIHKMSPVLLITVTAPLAAIGLFLYPIAADNTALFFIATTLLYVGVCFWWPTMLGITNERCPKTGALGLAIIGGAGSFSTAVGNPVFGGIIDKLKASLPETGVAAEMIDMVAPVKALQIWAVLPVLLFVVFLLVHLKDKASGGYQAEKLDVADVE